MTAKGALPANGTLRGTAERASVIGPKRQLILEILEDRPGLNLDEVAAALGVRRTAAKHHLRLLERGGYVVRLHQGRHVLHFRVGLPAIEQAMFRLFRIPSVRRVAEAVFLDDCKPRDALASQLDVTPRTVRRAIRQLAKAGLLRIERSPTSSRTLLHPRLRVLIARQAGPRLAMPQGSPVTREDLS
ncbi:MAG TPA: winged helix-turn-helix transcriptional regulator [Candidatus Thermoplasmatota archaeon]|nr:winged helix-turn-helix transcriptional regulator [Candidatus Thermoplasmatota archaeon]